jgi:hypothetical protein
MNTQKRPGRPPKSSGELKSDSMLVRLGPAEKVAFERAAELAGVGLSAWARERLRAAALRELDNVGETADFVKTRRSRSADE